ncbi:hypothetical protein ALC57_10813 [Trachymyrmex cornetzi]|uniref:Uncharacterized protein n=1 Tax=Trachymyrmex cornetzi TaxID=471704 RepID=A0A151J3F3_9HYME|nr:hypothetical protein ALC57_10813 [Trachymyrmex cornetzi]
MHGSHGLPALLPGKNKVERDGEEQRTDGIGSVPLEGELSRYCRSGSSPLDKASRSKRPPFWCSTG